VGIVTNPTASADYNSAVASRRTGHSCPDTVPGDTPTPEQPVEDRGATDSHRHDPASVENFLQLLARAVHQYHTYPASSPLCVDAITTVQKALATGDGHLSLRVTARHAVVGDATIGAGTTVEHELVHRLYRARVAALSIDRAATERDLSRFCRDLIAAAEGGEGATALTDALVEHGVDTIVAETAYLPEVLDLGAPPRNLCDLAARERSRCATGEVEGPTVHLYPRDKGWVRLDPSSGLSTISLAELAVLADDPSRVAEMLLRLADGGPRGAESRQAPLERKYSEVAALFASLDPDVGRLMFAKLARAVLALEPPRRRDLLRRTVLPALLDGHVDGTILQDFPDVELAESLVLLLDLENMRPEILGTALGRLNLPADRVRAIAALVDARIRSRAGATSAAPATRSDTGPGEHVGDLVRVDASAGKMFTDFTAFDLAIDEQTREAIALIPHRIGTTDLIASQLTCLFNLVRQEPNPVVVARLLARATSLLSELQREGRWRDIASRLVGYSRLADSFLESRPDVTDAIAAAVRAFCTKDRVLRISELYGVEGEPRCAANAFVEACGVSVVPAVVALLEDPTLRSKVQPLVQLLCSHAALLGPALAEHLEHVSGSAARAITRVLGFAGPGFETAIASCFGSSDEMTEREALRALARIGSAQAAALVAQQIVLGSPKIRGPALGALWNLPAPEAQSQVKELLQQREFMIRDPEFAVRLLDRVSATGVNGYGSALSTLAPLRFRFWNRALSRLGRRAHQMVRQ
jgi:hypothetical protein